MTFYIVLTLDRAMHYELKVLLSLFILATLLARPISNWLCRARAQRRANKWFAERLADRNPKELIDASPYSYGHWQGEFGYRIMDNRIEPPFVGFAPSIEHAERQILTLIFEEDGTTTR